MIYLLELILKGISTIIMVFLIGITSIFLALILWNGKFLDFGGAILKEIWIKSE